MRLPTQCPVSLCHVGATVLVPLLTGLNPSLALFSAGAILQTIPGPVKGGVEVMLFGMIAAVFMNLILPETSDTTCN